MEKALLDGLEERLTGEIHLKVERIQIDDVAEVEATTPTTIGLPSEFVVQTAIVNKTPPGAYGVVGLAVLIGALVFLVIRLLFADLIALIILTPFQWVGLVEGVQWRGRIKRDVVEEVQGGGLEFGATALNSPPASEAPGVLEGLDASAAPVELTSGVAEAATESTTLVTEVLSESVGGVAGGLGEVAGGCAEGCLGGIFG